MSIVRSGGGKPGGGLTGRCIVVVGVVASVSAMILETFRCSHPVTFRIKALRMVRSKSMVSDCKRLYVESKSVGLGIVGDLGIAIS